MLRSSEGIGALAAALAKAQSELENPAKSLTATIESPFPREGRRSFRYAPLAAGLDIIRKCLSQHEIATVQATAIDRDAGLIRLTTTLVHASGEWIASEWPVCPVGEAAAPHRTGAALTYARRYALFALVGIAGEDDLDAPDLLSATEPQNRPLAREPSGGAFSAPHGAKTAAGAPPRQQQPSPKGARKTAVLAPEASANRREQMLDGIERAANGQELDDWAATAWSGVNALTPTDGDRVREAFAARLAHWQAPDRSSPEATVGERAAADGNSEALAFPKEQRRRNKQHLRFVAKQPCLVCGRQPCDPHHLRFAQPRGLGLKVSDEFTVPLCRAHHRELHRTTKEVEWWSRTGVEPLQSARTLWCISHPTGRQSAGVGGT
jgi:hypothetical protein